MGAIIIINVSSKPSATLTGRFYDIPLVSQMREVRLGKAKWPISLTPLKSILVGFPGGVVVRNLPAKEEDMDSIPGAGRSHMPWSN